MFILKIVLDFIFYVIFRFLFVIIIVFGGFFLFKYFSNVFGYKQGQDISKTIDKRLLESQKANSASVNTIRAKIKSAPFKYLINNGKKFI